LAAGRVQRVQWKHITINWQLYVLALLPVAWLVIFMYFPMYGNVIAFKNFMPNKGIWGSPWIGLDNLTRFFRSYNFENVMWNTFFLSAYDLVFGFPIPVLLALAMHYCPWPRYKRTVQMVTYAPNFISMVVMVGIIFKLLTPRIGLVSMILGKFGVVAPQFLGSADLFSHVYVWSGIWQFMGWNTIIYLAALSGIDPELHEAARVDGANIWQRMWYIDLRGILPTIVILLILRSGSILSVGFEKIYLMQNTLNIRASEVIATYVYKVGLVSAIPSFSYAAAIGLFGNLINFVLLVAMNFLARRVGETSLW
jgi:putative aldouronate transport system permease protein